MQEYHWAQDKIDEVTQTTAERRHDWQAKAAERRLKQMAAKREKEMNCYGWRCIPPHNARGEPGGTNLSGANGA